MRSLISAAVLVMLGMIYVADPDAVRSAVAGTFQFGKSILQGGADAVSDQPATGPKTTQLPDGTWVQIPDGYQVQPAKP